MVSNTRLYGASIGIVSGLYSLWSGTGGARMVPAGWLMAVLGVLVLVHGAVLLTPAADRLGDASGPLMIAYAAVMLLLQALLGAGVLADGHGPLGDGMMDGGMGGGMSGGMGGSAMTAGMGWDAGMVALALLMLASGIIMAWGDTEAGERGGM